MGNTSLQTFLSHQTESKNKEFQAVVNHAQVLELFQLREFLIKNWERLELNNSTDCASLLAGINARLWDSAAAPLEVCGLQTPSFVQDLLLQASLKPEDLPLAQSEVNSEWINFTPEETASFAQTQSRKLLLINQIQQSLSSADSKEVRVSF